MTIDASPVMHENRRYLTIPRDMQDEYATFERFALTMLMWERISIKNKHGGNILRFLEWLWEKHGRQSSIPLTAAECIQFITTVVGDKQHAHETMKGYRASLLAYLRWQFNEGHISGDEILRLDNIKVTKAKHYKTRPVKALKRYELTAVFANIDRKWPYDIEFMDRYARGIHIGRNSRPKVRGSLENMQRYTLVLLALLTGMRREEIYNLRVQDVDIRNQTIYICGKGSKWRHCLYPQELRDQMQRFLSHRALVVGNRHDRLWFSTHGDWGAEPSFSAFDKWIGSIFDGSVDAGWHILRKTFATTCEKLGMPIGQISQLLGHEDERVTLRYLERDRQFVINVGTEYEHALTERFQKFIPARPHERTPA